MEHLSPLAPIEGFLYSISRSRSGEIYCRVIFCVLNGRHLAQYKAKGDEIPVRSGILDPVLRLEDAGRQVVGRQTLYTLRLYSVVDPSKQRFLGAASSEETAAWIKAFTLALQLPMPATEKIFEAFERDEGQPLSGEDSPVMSSSHSPTPDNIQSFRHLAEGMQHRKKSFLHLTTIGADKAPLYPSGISTSASPLPDLPSPDDTSTGSKWKLVRCENGLRFFEEISEHVIKYKFYALPVMKCVGVVKAEPSTIFQLVMEYGPERLQWDTTVDSGEVIETKDGHSDVVYIRLRQDWIWLRKRNLCLERYWIRNEDGSYAVFYKSVDHPKCPEDKGTVRAIIHSGGFIISPLKTSDAGKPRSLVEFVLEMDVSGWSSWFGTVLSPYPAFVRDSLLGCVAGIRDFFAAQRFSGSIQVVQWKVVEASAESAQEDALPLPSPRLPLASQPTASFLDTINDADDEFFDAFTDQSDTDSNDLLGVRVDPSGHPRPSDAQPDYLTGDWLSRGRAASSFNWPLYQGTVKPGPPYKGQNCWSQPDGNLFSVKGKTFLSDGKKVPAGNPSCTLVAVDWLDSDSRMDHVAQHWQSFVQKVTTASPVPPPFLFAINLQVPGSSHHSLVYYFEVEEKVKQEPGSLLHKFLFGDDDVFRNSKINLIPSVPEGSWIVKQAAGSSRPVPLGQIMEVNYYSAHNYFEMDINMGSSSVVRGVMSLVFGYISMLVVDMAFVLKGDTEEELPERLLGVARCSHLSLDAAVPYVRG